MQDRVRIDDQPAAFLIDFRLTLPYHHHHHHHHVLTHFLRHRKPFPNRLIYNDTKDIALYSLEFVGPRMMIFSLELRWFYPGQVPSKVTAWFENIDNGNFLIVEEPRQDCQIPIPESDHLSVKQRGNALEIKWRRSKESFSLLGGKIKGIAENWIKWAWIENQVTATSSYGEFCVQAPQGPTIKIAKERQVRRYHIKKYGNDLDAIRLHPIQTVPAGATGCSMELTYVQALGSSWWSLALETFGSEKIDDLKIVEMQLLSTFPGLPLIQENSYGYPHWLGALIKTKPSQKDK